MPDRDDATFRVAAFQGSIRQGDPEASLDRACQALEWADERDVHVLCMPETYLQGYFESRQEAWENSISLDSSEFADLCSRLGRYRATLLLGLNERRGSDLYNTMVVIERGRLVGRYSKNYLVFSYFRPGLEFPVFECAGVRYGILICYDSCFTEPARIMAMRGAQVIFSAHFNRFQKSWGEREFRRLRHRHVARAVDNKCWIVRSNILWPDDGNTFGIGDSFIVDPDGEFVAEAGRMTETILFHAIPRGSLCRPEDRPWLKTHRGIYEALHAEYRRVGAEG